MKVNIQSVNFNISSDLRAFVESKAEALDKVYDKIINAEVYLKVQSTSEKENKNVEIKINIPGDEFMVKKKSKSFEEGVDLAVESLKRILRKKKQKQRIHH